MCRISINSYRKKRIFVKICTFFFIVALACSSILVFVRPVLAEDYACIATMIDPATKEIESAYMFAFDDVLASYYQADPNSYCRINVDSPLSYGSSYTNKILIGTNIYPSTLSPGKDQTTYNSVRLLTPQELIDYACLFPSSGSSAEVDSSFLAVASQKFLNLLPSSPDEVKIPTILNNMIGQGSLGANAAIEIYSGIWQYLTIIVFVKFYKLIPGKST